MQVANYMEKTKVTSNFNIINLKSPRGLPTLVFGISWKKFCTKVQVYPRFTNIKEIFRNLEAGGSTR